MSRKVGLCALLLGLVLGGCGKKQTVIYDQPEYLEGGHWETAWVDPRMVISDTLFTLIRTARIDSFFVDQPLPTRSVPAAVHFHVDASECFVAVSIVDADESILKPLIAQSLPRGYYKFSLHFEKLSEEFLNGTGYFLKAYYCGKNRLEPIDFR